MCLAMIAVLPVLVDDGARLHVVPGNGVEDWVGVSKVDAVNASGHGSGDRE